VPKRQKNGEIRHRLVITPTSRVSIASSMAEFHPTRVELDCC
jgi:hypothetical protein